MPATDWGWLITPEELQGWILEQSPDLLILNKPPHVVVHRSRFGPWSSLVGACREYLGDDVLRMPFRLDRQALHCTKVEFDTDRGTETFAAPPPADLVAFVQTNLGCAWT